jgi:hypothetical protein
MRAALVLHAGRIAVGSIGTEATAVAGQPVDDIERLRATLPSSGASFTISRAAAEALGIGAAEGFAAPSAQEPDANAARTAWAAPSLATLVARPRSL